MSEPELLRVPLTPEQCAMLDVLATGRSALVFGIASRHPWPRQNERTLCVMAVPYEKAWRALEVAGLLEKDPRRKSKKRR